MTTDALSKELKAGRLRPVYFFYGDERFLLENRLNSIRKRTVAPGFEDFNFFRFSGKKVSLEAVIEAVEQFPQMSDKKLVLVQDSGFLQNAAAKEYKRIKTLVGELPDYVCLVFTEEAFDKKKEKNLAFIEEAGGGVVAFDYLPAGKLELWIEERFEKAGIRVLTSDISYLVRICGQSMGKLDMEFQKLTSYLGSRTKLTRADIDAVVDRTVEYRVYDMLANMIDSRSEKAREQLKFLQDTKEKPHVVLGIMMGKLSELLLCKRLKEDGLSQQEIGQYFDFKRPAFAVKKTIEESKRFGEPYLMRMLDKGLKYDLDIKTGRMDGWTAVELYLAELTLL